MPDDNARILDLPEMAELLRSWVPAPGWTRKVALDLECPQMLVVAYSPDGGMVLVELGPLSERDLVARLDKLPGAWADARASLGDGRVGVVDVTPPPRRDSASNN